MIKWLNINIDGLYPLSKATMRRSVSAIYINGDNPNGAFCVGIIDDAGNFTPCPNGTSNKSFIVEHGKGVKLYLRVKGYAGTHTTFGYPLTPSRRVAAMIMRLVSPVVSFLFDQIIDRILKR